MYKYLWEDGGLVVLGYGGKKLEEYLGGELRESVGFENGERLVMEVYVGFGVIWLGGLLLYGG